MKRLIKKRSKDVDILKIRLDGYADNWRGVWIKTFLCKKINFNDQLKILNTKSIECQTLKIYFHLQLPPKIFMIGKFLNLTVNIDFLVIVWKIENAVKSRNNLHFPTRNVGNIFTFGQGHDDKFFPSKNRRKSTNEKERTRTDFDFIEHKKNSYCESVLDSSANKVIEKQTKESESLEL